MRDAREARILVVDDEVSSAQAVAELLRVGGYETQVALSCEEALESVTDCLPDLILSDINMPCHNGFELLEMLRQDEVAMHVPLVFVTAMTRPEDREACLRAGADDYVEKPVVPERLLDSVRTHLKAA